MKKCCQTDQKVSKARRFYNFVVIALLVLLSIGAIYQVFSNNMGR